MQDSIEIEKNIKVLEAAKFHWKTQLNAYIKDGVTVTAETVMDMGHIEFCNYLRTVHLIELVPIKE